MGTLECTWAVDYMGVLAKDRAATMIPSRTQPGSANKQHAQSTCTNIVATKLVHINHVDCPSCHYAATRAHATRL